MNNTQRITNQSSESNPTLKGDYLWTNMIVGEVFPSATTLSTWSVWQDFFNMLSMGNIPTIERIAGRPYLNYSLMYSFMMKIMRKHDRVVNFIKDSVGVPPDGVEVPPFPVSWKTVLFQVIPSEFKNELKKTRLMKNAPDFLNMVQMRCQELIDRIESASQDKLIDLWKMEIRPLWKEIHPLQDKMNEQLNLGTRKLKTDLTKLLGSDQANALLTTINSAGELASLGPLVGIVKVKSGELTREEYLQRYGHRGPNENELAEPRPYEAPDWLDHQLMEFSNSPVDVMALLDKRNAEFDVVRKRIMQQLPAKQAREIGYRINVIVETNTLREATRSELTRLVGVIRRLFLRAGEITGLDDDVFFLTVDELMDYLSGDQSAATQISARRDTYEQFNALQHLPPWIRGGFDPVRWGSDPDRRLDVYDPHTSVAPVTSITDLVIKGFPGSAGCVEGIVQRIDSPEQGDQLQPQEILVTGMTNVGWTPLFPRAAAVVTDFGGSLSHAAIVARELGIPAVVGCGDATTRLKTGDRVRVDGGTGTVTLLQNGQENN